MSIRLPNSVFVHIPRTSGMWFGEIVQQLGIKVQILKGDLDGHLAYKDMPSSWRKLPAFSFVRHPVTWLLSRWSHALEHRVCQDYRHFGIHRIFDECVRDTLEGTITTILGTHPGLVSRTFKEMTEGVQYLRRMRDQPLASWDLLSHLEGIEPEKWEQVKGLNPFNGTSGLPQYKEALGEISPSLLALFVESEQEAMEMWQGANLSPECLAQQSQQIP